MNTPNPVDPDKLRAHLTQVLEPVKPSPDALVRIKAGARKRRRLQWTIGSGAGVLAIAGATAAVVAVGSLGDPSALHRTTQPGYSPTVTTTTTTLVPSTVPTETVSAAPTTAPSPAAPPAGTTTSPSTVITTAGKPAAVTSTAVITSPVAHDLDGDGKADTAVVQRTGSKVQLVVHLAGRTVASAPFGLATDAVGYPVTFVSINRDGRSEMLVTGLGASATPHYLFQYANGKVSEVAAPSGLADPWLPAGGGQNVTLAFDCTSNGLVVTAAGPTSFGSNFNPNTDKSYLFRTATYRFQGETLVKQSGTTRTGLTRVAGLALAAAEPHGRCGAPL